MSVGKIFGKLQNISPEQLEKIDNLVPRTLIGTVQKQCKFEVLVFYTKFEYDLPVDENNLKKKIFAKFRSYEDAEEYAQMLIIRNIGFHKIILRA